MGKQSRYVFTEEDDQKLRTLVEQVGLKWNIIAEEMKLKPRQCRDRWNYYLKPDAIEDRSWNKEEDEYLKSEVEQFGTRWAYIGEKMGRTDIQVKNRYNLLRRKEAKRMSQRIPPPMIKRRSPKKVEVKKPIVSSRFDFDSDEDELPPPRDPFPFSVPRSSSMQRSLYPQNDDENPFSQVPISDEYEQNTPPPSIQRNTQTPQNTPSQIPPPSIMRRAKTNIETKVSSKFVVDPSDGYISHRPSRSTFHTQPLPPKKRIQPGQKVPINLIQFPPFDDDDDDDLRPLTPPMRNPYPIPQFNRPQYNQPQYKTQPTSPVSQSSFRPMHYNPPKEKNIHNTFHPYVPQEYLPGDYDPNADDLTFEYDPMYLQ